MEACKIVLRHKITRISVPVPLICPPYFEKETARDDAPLQQMPENSMFTPRNG